MNLLKPIVSQIQNILSKNGIDEFVDVRISNLDNYDYQINNLVKYQNHTNIDSIKDAVSKLLESSDLVDFFEYANNLFINIQINAESIILNLENIEENIRRSDFDKLSSSDDGDDIKKMSAKPKGKNKRTGVPINRQDLHIL